MSYPLVFYKLSKNALCQYESMKWFNSDNLSFWIATNLYSILKCFHSTVISVIWGCDFAALPTLLTTPCQWLFVALYQCKQLKPVIKLFEASYLYHVLYLDEMFVWVSERDNQPAEEHMQEEDLTLYLFYSWPIFHWIGVWIMNLQYK